MDRKHFKESSTGSLTTTLHHGGEALAFVPNPLPPDWQPDREVWANLSEADRALGELAGRGKELENPRLFIRPFLRTEAVVSSRIEGTQADLEDLYAFEVEQKSGKESKETEGRKSRRGDTKEVHNYVTALEYGLERLDEIPVIVRLLRELHRRLLSGVRGERQRPGEFRNSQNWIGPEGRSIEEARFVPPPPAKVEDLMANLEEYVNTADDYPPLIRLALIHYQFETIHPFRDGNGRIGRLLITLLIVHWKLLPLPLLTLSAYFERHRDEYMDRLLAVSRDGDWSGWVRFFLEGVKVQSEEANQTARRLSKLKADWRETIQSQPRSSALQLALVDHLFQQPMFSIPQAAELLGVSYQSAKNNVERLEEEGILNQVPDTYPQLYAATEILMELSRNIRIREDDQTPKTRQAAE